MMLHLSQIDRMVIAVNVLVADRWRRKAFTIKHEAVLNLGNVQYTINVKESTNAKEISNF